MALRSSRWVKTAGLLALACTAPVAAQAPSPTPTGPTVVTPAPVPPTPTDAPVAGGAPAASGSPAGDPDGFPALPGNVPWPTVAATVSSDAEAAADVRYTLNVAGWPGAGLDSQFRALSSLWAKRGETANLAQINRRLNEDRDLIDQLLRSVGHYGGEVAATITPGATPGAPTRVSIAIAPGPVYHFDTIAVVPEGAPNAAARTALAIEPGQVVDALRVNTALAALPLKLADAGYPFAQIGSPDISVDHATRTAQLTLSVQPGPRGIFGAVRFAEPNPRFSDRHLALLARLKPGDAYNATDLEDLRRALIQTSLFGSVSVKPVAAGPVRPDGTERVDLVVTAEGAPLRTVALGGGYSTRQGIRLEGSWQHRNFFPPEGALTVRTVAAENEQLLSGEVRYHNWRKRDQTLMLRAQASAEQLDAYNATSFTLDAAIERETNIIWQKKWHYSFGVEAVVTTQRDLSAVGNPKNTYYIVALPGFLTYDGSDDLLNPGKGFRLTGRASPEYSLKSGNSFAYVKLQLEGSYYLPLGPIVLAGRAHLGSIVGASRGTIAPDRRFYAGGGGSVRGYDYQGVGPRDADGNPLGGNGLAEFSIEARYRFKAFGSDVGIVPFFDGGQVTSSSVPKLTGLQYGAGIGFRYYTQFGPVRLDLATPLNRRPGDPRVAFYVSIGQAF